MEPGLAVLTASATLFAAMATLMLGLFAWLRADMRRMEGRIEARMNERFDRMNERLDRMDERFDRIETRLAAVEHGQAKLEGLLEGLREAIAGRVPHNAE